MRIAPTAAALIAVVALLLGAAPAVQATACTTVPIWPGAAAPRPAVAAWMATGATAAGIPGELPVMGALVESGLTNARDADGDRAGYFGMRLSIWLGMYPGFPDDPQMQLRWFTDQALSARAARAARGIDNADPSTWGDWVADVERPAEQLRGRYQPRLADAQALIAAGCPATGPGAPSPGTGAPPPAGAGADTTPPALSLSDSGRRRLTRAGGLRVRLRCPDEACRATVRGRLALAGRRRTLPLPTVRANLAAGRARTVTLTPGRAVRRAVARALRRGSAVRAPLRITATDGAGNVTTLTPVIRIL